MCVSASGVIVITRFVGAAVSAVLLSATGVFFVDGLPTKAAAPQRVKRRVAARRMVDGCTSRSPRHPTAGRHLELLTVAWPGLIRRLVARVDARARVVASVAARGLGRRDGRILVAPRGVREEPGALSYDVEPRGATS